MSADLHQRAHELFSRLRRLPAAERPPLLDATCAGDDELRGEVEAMLELIDESSGFLETQGPGANLRAQAERAFGDRDSTEFEEEELPKQVGSYRIIGKLGEGGMGAVLEAEQAKPRRRVALKLLRSGLPTGEVLRRFERESEILGRLRHPGIAQVFEAGVTDIDGGRRCPFFALELIRGATITEHAQRRSLGPRERMQLLVKVCEAVSHAHAAGIVHRDLKPGNVLVDDHGQPKVLDFGVARAIGADGPGATMQTHTGEIVGTLLYMSPEQASGRPESIGVQTDVYALGVLAYELLTGRLPHELRDLPLHESLRTLQEDSARRLSTIDPALRGDLETIVGKALEKDPARRYHSAAELAADLERWLAHEPILARPPSALYQAAKFARRHRAVVIGACFGVVALLTGTAVAIQQAIVARSAEAEALAQAYRAQLGAAQLAIDAADSNLAIGQLDATPVDLRGWEWDYLRARTGVDATEVRGPGEHPAPMGLTFEPNDGPLRIAWHDGERVWLQSWALDAAGPTPALPLGPEQALPRRFDFDYRAISRFSTDRELLRRLGDFETMVADLPGHRLHALDGARTLGVMDARGDMVTLFDPRTGERRLDIDADVHDDAKISPDGRFFAHGSHFRAGLYRCDTGEAILSLTGDWLRMRAVAFSADSRRLATGSTNGTVAVWDTETGRELGRASIDEGWQVTALTFSGDGSRIVSGGDDGLVRVHDGLLKEKPIELGLFDSSVHVVAANANGDRIAAGSSRGAVRSWDLTTGPPRSVLTGHESFVYPIVFSHDGERFYSAGWDGTLRAWSAQTGRARETFRPPAKYYYCSLSLSPDDKRADLLDAAGRWFSVNLEDGTWTSLEADHDGYGEGALAWHPQRRVIALARLEELQLRDPDRLETLRSVTGLRHFPSWSPDGTLLAAGSDVCTAEIVDGETLGGRRCLGTRPIFVRWISWKPDGSQLAVSGDSGHVSVFDVASRRLLADLRPSPLGRSYAVTWSPDGRRLLAGAGNGSIAIWNAETFDLVLTLRGHEEYVYGLAFSADGRVLVSGSGDTNVRYWDSRPFSEVVAVRKAEDLVSSTEEP